MSGYIGSSSWADQRLPGSFRGVPFIILENNLRRGRQTVLHVYPFRDDPWPEDLGRSPRLTSFRGFVVGDDADQQMQSLMAATEVAGPGLLTHPVLGSFMASLISFTCSDQVDRGRVWSFEMTVVPYFPRLYPVGAVITQSVTQGLLGSVGTALAKDFAAVQATVTQVRTAVGGVVQTVQGYAAQAQGLIHDATSLAHIPTALAGNFGRFAGGSRSGGLPGFTSFAQASGTVNGAFASVGRISSSLSGLASLL